jgi:hypothetical protein
VQKTIITFKVSKTTIITFNMYKNRLILIGILEIDTML